MKRIRDIEDYEDDKDETEFKYRPKNFRLKTIPQEEYVKRKQWDKEHSYDRPTDVYDDYW